MITAPAANPSDRTALRVQPLDRIDMYDPAATCRLLGIEDRALLALVNTGELAAYDLDGAIRFCRADVRALARDERHARVRQTGEAA